MASIPSKTFSNSIGGIAAEKLCLGSALTAENEPERILVPGTLIERGSVGELRQS